MGTAAAVGMLRRVALHISGARRRKHAIILLPSRLFRHINRLRLRVGGQCNWTNIVSSTRRSIRREAKL